MSSSEGKSPSNSSVFSETTRVQQLLCFLYETTTALDSINLRYIDVVYIWILKKVFDKVSHSGLLVKLVSLGVNGNVWFSGLGNISITEGNWSL